MWINTNWQSTLIVFVFTRNSSQNDGISSVLAAKASSRNKRTRQNHEKHTKAKKRESVDTKTIKLCASLTLLFLLSFPPVLLNILQVTKSFFIVYLYFINHFGNPIIYCFVNTDFRTELFIISEKLQFWKR